MIFCSLIKFDNSIEVLIWSVSLKGVINLIPKLNVLVMYITNKTNEWSYMANCTVFEVPERLCRGGSALTSMYFSKSLLK